MKNYFDFQNVRDWNTHLDKIWKLFFTGGTGEIAVSNMNCDMFFEKIQSIKRFCAENTGVRFQIRVQFHVWIESRTVYEAFVTDITGQWIVALSPMEVQVLIQLLFLPKCLPTVQTFKWSKSFTYKEMM